MPTFKRKPQEVQAWQFDGTSVGFLMIRAAGPVTRRKIRNETEGTLTALVKVDRQRCDAKQINPTDWMVLLDGLYYDVMTASEFEALYEEV